MFFSPRHVGMCPRRLRSGCTTLDGKEPKSACRQGSRALNPCLAGRQARLTVTLINVLLSWYKRTKRSRPVNPWPTACTPAPRSRSEPFGDSLLILALSFASLRWSLLFPTHATRSRSTVQGPNFVFFLSSFFFLRLGLRLLWRQAVERPS
jgi:hypothetical protein